jgi:hypothetical protein
MSIRDVTFEELLAMLRQPKPFNKGKAWRIAANLPELLRQKRGGLSRGVGLRMQSRAASCPAPIVN